MQIAQILARKRDGQELSAAELRFFIESYTSGALPDYQAAAWLMAVYLRGMTTAETAALTAAMADSGRRIAPEALPKPSLDKHSTGGVGDKVTLVVVPLLAATGVRVCKMSGRGLGHTGGTLDKLEAIPGFRVAMTPEAMQAQVRAIGACLAGQTDDLAPADRKLYALRDVTATVGSLPLIVSSILSKKLAGGASSFLFDVKVGGGALMKTQEEARALAQALLDGAAAHGRRAVALLSDMSQPLGRTVGNALEVAEAISVLSPEETSRADSRLRALCLELAIEGVALAAEVSRDQAWARVESALVSGAARECLARIVAAQGGDASVVSDPTRLPQARVQRTLAAPREGWLSAVDAARLGEIVVALGGGRQKKEDIIDPAVGLRLHLSVGQWTALGGPLVTVYAAEDRVADQVSADILAAFSFSATAVEAPELVLGVWQNQI